MERKRRGIRRTLSTDPLFHIGFCGVLVKTRRPTLLIHLFVSTAVIVACRHMVRRRRGVGRGRGLPGVLAWGFATGHGQSDGDWAYLHGVEVSSSH